MIRARVKADQVRVWGESAIVLHNPASFCSFIWMKRSKKKGFVRPRPPFATAAELSSSLCFASFQMYFLSRTLRDACFFLLSATSVICSNARRSQQAFICILAAISACLALSCESWRGACVTACLEIARCCSSLWDFKGTHTNPHINNELYFLYASSRKGKKEIKKKKTRIESSLKWKLEGPRESQRETHMEESAVCWMDLSWGRTLPLCPLFEVRHRPYVQAPERGTSTSPP